MPDETLAEMCVWLRDRDGVSISTSRLCTMLRRLKPTRKKRHSTLPSRSVPTSRRRGGAPVGREPQPGLNPKHLIFIDETRASTSMAGRHDRAPRGRRCLSSVPHGHWLTTTFLAAIRRDAMAAPCVFDGPIDGGSFRARATQFLAPTLEPGDIVIMDNLSSHKVDGIQQTIETAGAALRYLPPYSPDLNSIEKAFAKLKAFIRKAAGRTYDTPFHALVDAISRFKTAEFQNYFCAAGCPR